MNLRPLYDRIVVQPDPAEEMSPGGIILAPQAQEKSQVGTVRSVGHGRLIDSGEVVPMQVKTGDRVMYSKYAGNEVKIGGEKLLIIRENEVLGVLE